MEVFSVEFLLISLRHLEAPFIFLIDTVSPPGSKIRVPAPPC